MAQRMLDDESLQETSEADSLSSGAEDVEMEDSEDQEEVLPPPVNSCFVPDRPFTRRPRFRLHELCAAGQIEEIKQYLADQEVSLYLGSALSRRDTDGCTPLHHAILNAQLESFRLLLAAGADPRTRCEGSSPIHMAVALGSLQPFPHTDSLDFSEQAVTLLKAHPTLPADLAVLDDHARTPGLLAAQLNLPSLLQLLVPSPATNGHPTSENPDTAADSPDLVVAMDIHGNSLLHMAARHKDPELLQAVLGLPGIQRVQLQNSRGDTPLHIAAFHNNVRTVELLLGSHLSAQTLSETQNLLGLTPAQVAARRGFQALSAFLDADPESKSRSAALKKARANDTPRDSPAEGRTLVICDERGEEHYTCPDPIRPSSDPPSENIRRLQVLTHPAYGVLRAKPFAEHLRWTEEARRADIVDILRVHEYNYVRKLDEFCRQIPDNPLEVRNLDPDTSISTRSFEAALRAAGASCEAVDEIMLQPSGPVRNVFCAVRPPGHHAGPFGIVTSPNDPHGTHGFCLLNNVAIAAAYARAVYRSRGIRRVAILDFDVHHGNGTEAIVRNVQPSEITHVLKAPFLQGKVSSLTYKPWLNQDDKDEIFFASVHGYGRKDPGYSAYLYPGSGRSNFECPPPPSLHSGSLDQASPSPSEAGPLNSVDEGDILPPQGCDLQKRLPDPSRTNFEPQIHHTHHRRVQETLRGAAADRKEGEEEATRDSQDRLPPPPPSWIFNLGLPVIDPQNTLTQGRREWRKVWRDRVLTQLYHFKPDFIFISAGFDGHIKDTINFGYLSLREDDYYWLTRQIAIAANTLCQGRLVSVLEGGYKVEGRVVSAFGRSVAEHVRALTETRPEEVFQAADWHAERRNELTQEKILAEKAQEQVRAAQEAEEQEHRAFLARLHALQEKDAASATTPAPAADPPSEAPGNSSPADAAEQTEAVTVSSRGRRRRGPPVDYAKLNAKMDQELARKKQKVDP